ncbi:MAG: WD40/YVTN/BNR-like repeat-containing protein [Acidobacteriota bacterium]
MRASVLLLLFFAASNLFSQDPGGCFPRGVTTPDRSTVYLLCEDGIALRRVDDGAWEMIRVPASRRLRALHFVTPDRGFVTGDSGLVLETIDGGKTWRSVDLDTQENLTAVQAVGDKVWVAGFGGVVFHSADGGKTWRPQRTFVTQPIDGLHFIDENRGWAVGWSGLLLRTTDGGNSWQQIKVPGVWENLSDIRFRGPQNGWAVGMYGVMLRTRDGGASWQRQPVATRAWLTSLDFGPDGTMWVAAEYHLLRSDDGSETWEVLPHGSPMAVTRVVATTDSVLGLGPSFLLTRSGNESSWLRANLDELVRSARELSQEKTGARTSGGPS